MCIITIFTTCPRIYILIARIIMHAFSSFCEFSGGDVRLVKNDFPKSGESVGKLWPKVRKKGKYTQNIISCRPWCRTKSQLCLSHIDWTYSTNETWEPACQFFHCFKMIFLEKKKKEKGKKTRKGSYKNKSIAVSSSGCLEQTFAKRGRVQFFYILQK